MRFTFTPARHWSALANILLSMAALHAGNSWAQERAERALLDMRQAFAANQSTRLTALLPQVRGHALEPLAAYWTLRSRLPEASAEEIEAFLKRYAGTYYEDRLRNDWLLQLGQQRDWSTFQQQHPHYRMKDDREVQCYALLARHVAPPAATVPTAEPPPPQASALAAQTRQLWLSQRKADDGCAALAEQLLKDGTLPAAVAWQRARLGMEQSQATLATQAVALLDPDWVAQVQAIHGNPERYLDEKVTAIRPRTKELVTLALVRLAVRDPQAAATEAGQFRWRVQLTEEELAWVWGVIGKRTAIRLQPEASAHFAQADNRYLNDDLLAWKTRAALRAGDWTQVRAAIEAMEPTQRAEPTWTYWLARALQAGNRPSDAGQARTLWQEMAGTGGFYEQLALEALGQNVNLPSTPPPLTAQEKAGARQNPGLRRALLAIELGLRSEGVREWNYSVALHTPGGMGERELLAAADLACAHEVWDRCINTSERTRNERDHLQRFPTPFRESVLRHAQAVGLEPAYVYGLIRQESRFVTQARSHVGASGLMQVMPATASWTARRIGLKSFKPEQITDRDTNIRIGTAYLKLALDDFEGSMALAAAAYNAGPGRSRQWRNGPTLEAAIWIENIPFDETRDYVKRVLSNTTNYAALLSGQPQRLSSRLGPIGPRKSSATPPDTDLP